MPNEEIKAAEWGAVKFILLVVVAVILGNLIFNATSDGIHKYRRMAYLKNNPGAATNQPATQQVIAQPGNAPQQLQNVVQPGITALNGSPLTPDGTQWEEW